MSATGILENLVAAVEAYERYCVEEHGRSDRRAIIGTSVGKFELIPKREETQALISDWATETFGTPGSNASVAARANIEMAELLFALAKDDSHPKAAEEVADVLIVLYRLAQRLGVDIHEEVDKKMRVNRQREWDVEGGHGRHK